MFSAIRVYNFSFFPHAIRMLVFILLFLCKPSFTRSGPCPSPCAERVTFAALGGREAALGGARASCCSRIRTEGDSRAWHSKVSPQPGGAQGTASSPASQSGTPQGTRQRWKSSPKGTWCRTSLGSRGVTVTANGICSLNTDCGSCFLPVSR